VLQLKLCFGTERGEGSKPQCVMRQTLTCVAGRGRRWKMVMCAAVNFMFCYKLADMEGNCNVCCIYRYG